MNRDENRCEKIKRSFVEKVNEEFGYLDPYIILHGSFTSGNLDSDFDVAIILNEYDKNIEDRIRDIVIKFHEENNLKIDNEVPFEKKCIYSFYELEQVIRHPPFNIVRGKFNINRIEKNKEFLCSNEVKYRILLNIFTNYYEVLQGNEEIVRRYRIRAWETVIRIIYSYNDVEYMNIEEFVSKICKDKFAHVEGEDYLGYKIERLNKGSKLYKEITYVFDALVREGKVKYEKEKGYKCKKEWLLELSDNVNSFCIEEQKSKLSKYPKMQGLDFSENANPLGPSEKVKNALKQCSQYINVYSDYKNIDANSELAKFFKIPLENVALANGSLEAIFALPKFLNKEHASIIAPTFWGYEASLKYNNCRCYKYEMGKDFEYDEEQLNEIAKKSTILYICNPNNPTSSYIKKASIKKIIENNKNCHFIVDESHLLLHNDYLSETLASNVESLKNVSLVYSLSKLFSVAGLRVGALVSNSDIIKKYKEWQIPYSLSTISQVLFPIIMRDNEFLYKTRREIPKLTQELSNELSQIPWLKVKPSKTNFILCKIVGDISAIDLARILSDKKMYIRELTTDYKELEGQWIRISVNNRVANSKLINFLKNMNVK